MYYGFIAIAYIYLCMGVYNNNTIYNTILFTRSLVEHPEGK